MMSRQDDTTGSVAPQRIAPGQALAELFAEKLIAISLDRLPERTRDVALDDLIDAAGEPTREAVDEVIAHLKAAL